VRWTAATRPAAVREVTLITLPPGSV